MSNLLRGQGFLSLFVFRRTMEHKGTKLIETERLILRKFQSDDLEAMFNNFESDVQMTKFLR